MSSLADGYVQHSHQPCRCFCEVWQPAQMRDNKTEQTGQVVLYYQSFSTTDFLNCKHHTLTYSKKPQVLINLMESVFRPISIPGSIVSSYFSCSLILRKDNHDIRSWRLAKKVALDNKPRYDCNLWGKSFLLGYRRQSSGKSKRGKEAHQYVKGRFHNIEIRGVSWGLLWGALRGVPYLHPSELEGLEKQWMVNATFRAKKAFDIHRKL